MGHTARGGGGARDGRSKWCIPAPRHKAHAGSWPRLLHPINNKPNPKEKVDGKKRTGQSEDRATARRSYCRCPLPPPLPRPANRLMHAHTCGEAAHCCSAAAARHEIPRHAARRERLGRPRCLLLKGCLRDLCAGRKRGEGRGAKLRRPGPTLTGKKRVASPWCAEATTPCAPVPQWIHQCAERRCARPARPAVPSPPARLLSVLQMPIPLFRPPLTALRTANLLLSASWPATRHRPSVRSSTACPYLYRLCLVVPPVAVAVAARGALHPPPLAPAADVQHVMHAPPLGLPPAPPAVPRPRPQGVPRRVLRRQVGVAAAAAVAVQRSVPHVVVVPPAPATAAAPDIAGPGPGVRPPGVVVVAAAAGAEAEVPRPGGQRVPVPRRGAVAAATDVTPREGRVAAARRGGAPARAGGGLRGRVR